MKYIESKIVGNMKYIVKVRLDDECKNGHQDFSATISIYTKTKNGRWIDFGGGCDHETIIKQFPNLKIFCDLHLSDYNGIPMYAVANGMYHITQNMPMLDFMNHYRVSAEQYNVLKTAENTIEYSIMLEELGILKQWKKEAKEAIKYLEKLTGEKFINTSYRSNYEKPSAKDIANFKKQKAEGYYSQENKDKRAKQAKYDAIEKKRADIISSYKKEINNAEMEREIAIMILDNIGLNDNYIYYPHSKEIACNWCDYRAEINIVDYMKIQRALHENPKLSGLTLNDKRQFKGGK